MTVIMFLDYAILFMLGFLVFLLCKLAFEYFYMYRNVEFYCLDSGEIVLWHIGIIKAFFENLFKYKAYTPHWVDYEKYMDEMDGDI